MPRCEGTKVPLLRDGEALIRILVSAPEAGARYGNFFFNTKDEPIDVTAHELAGLKSDGRLAILTPGEMGQESVEKDNRIAALLQEQTTLRGRIVELEGQVKDRDAALRRSQLDLEEATAPANLRSPSITDLPGKDESPSRARGGKHVTQEVRAP